MDLSKTSYLVLFIVLISAGVGTASAAFVLTVESLTVTGDTELDGKLLDNNNEAGTSGQVLSSTESGIDWIDAPSGSGGSGSVFTRWGNPAAPAGTTLLYTGFTYGNPLNSGGGGSNHICLQGGDPGADATAAVDNGDLIWSTNTHGLDMPPGITTGKNVHCAVAFADSTSFVNWGSDTCPTGWSSAYSGYVMSSKFNDDISDRICVDNVNFDASSASSSSANRLQGTILWESDNFDQVAYPEKTFVQCSVCLKD